jgi:hypothetical protein
MRLSIQLVAASTIEGPSKDALAGIIVASIISFISLLVVLTCLVLYLRRKPTRRACGHTLTIITENEESLPSLPSKGLLAFGKSGKTNGRADLDQDSSMEALGAAPPPESQNLAVSGNPGGLLVSVEMLDEQQAMIHAPMGANAS